jgi:uncharacterized protein (UPF0335 family)
MSGFSSASYHDRLVSHIQDLERLEAIKAVATDNMKGGFERAKAAGFDPATLRVVLRLRKMTPSQRRDRRALEAIYMAELGMLDGDALPEEARRRLDGAPDQSTPDQETNGEFEPHLPSLEIAPTPAQAQLVLKSPEEARAEGEAAAAAGKRIYDNPYPAGDPCRAAWDEGWCAKRQSHGMELPQAYQRRTPKPPHKGPDQSGGESHEGAA